jgi:hypothetical protein
VRARAVGRIDVVQLAQYLGVLPAFSGLLGLLVYLLAEMLKLGFVR